VLHGVIAADPESYLAVEPDWTPTLPARGDAFRLADLLVPATQAIDGDQGPERDSRG